nr:hypothetical protein ISGA_11050 [Gordonia sp. NB41Y]
MILISCKSEKPVMVDLGNDIPLIHASAALTKFHSCRQVSCPANGYEIGQRLADGIRTLLDNLTDGRVYLVTTTSQTSADLTPMIATAYNGLHD